MYSLRSLFFAIFALNVLGYLIYLVGIKAYFSLYS